MSLDGSRLLVLVLVTILSALVTSAHKPDTQIDETEALKKVKVLEGEGVLFPCNATENPDADVWWVKNKTRSHFLSSGLLLRFNVVNRMDSGQYLCYVNNTDDVTNSTGNTTLVDAVMIDVIYPAEVAYMYGGPQVIEENQTFTISCGIVGNPSPVFELVNNDTGMGMASGNLAANFSLTSPPATCYYSGLYMCTTRNKLNEKNSTRTVNITVLCKPELDLSYGYPRNDVMASIGRKAEFDLHVLFHPTANVTWYKNGTSQDWPFAKKGSDIHNPKLIFDNVTVDAFGSYTVKVTNSRGSLIVNFNLKATGRPENPTDMKLLNYTYNRVTFSFFSGYNSGSQQRFALMKLVDNTFSSIDWFDDYSNTDGHQTLVFTSNALMSDTDYKIAVDSENGYGTSPFSNAISFRTPPYPYDPDQSSHGSKVGIIVGSVMGSLGALVLLALLLYVVKYRRTRYSHNEIKGSNRKV